MRFHFSLWLNSISLFIYHILFIYWSADEFLDWFCIFWVYSQSKQSQHTKEQDMAVLFTVPQSRSLYIFIFNFWVYWELDPEILYHWDISLNLLILRKSLSKFSSLVLNLRSYSLSLPSHYDYRFVPLHLGNLDDFKCKFYHIFQKQVFLIK